MLESPMMENIMPQRTFGDLTDLNRPPLTTSELARITGMSPTFIRTAIRKGLLRAVAVGNGRRRVFRIHPQDAFSYARELGFL